MTELTTFNFNQTEVRTSRTEAGDPLFCLADVCKCLEITDPSNINRQICEEFCDPCLTRVTFLDMLGRSQEYSCLTEPQLYFVMMRSRSEHAREFRQWVCNEVLPSIRKTGGYGEKGSITAKLKDTKLVLESKTDIALALDKVYQEHYGVSALSYLPAAEPAPVALPQNSTAAFVKGIGLKRLCERTVPEWYNLYVEYCYNHGKAPIAKTEFSKQAKRCGLQIVRKRMAGKIVKVFTAK